VDLRITSAICGSVNLNLVVGFIGQLARSCEPSVGGISLTGHLNRGIDGVYEIVGVVGRGLVSVAEVHAIVARAHRAQAADTASFGEFVS
jgi:hypothetical protein